MRIFLIIALLLSVSSFAGVKEATTRIIIQAADKSTGELKGFSCSASQVFYKNKYYLVTAKHCIEDDESNILTVALKTYDDAVVLLDVKRFKKSNTNDVVAYPLNSYILPAKLEISTSINGSIRVEALTNNPEYKTKKGSSDPYFYLSTGIGILRQADMIDHVISGDSGSPIINSSNELVGILSTRREDNEALMGFVPVSYLRYLLDE